MDILTLDIQYVSNLRININNDWNSLIVKSGDILVLAGNTSPAKSPKLYNFLRNVCSQFEYVILIPGDYEYHESTIKEANNILSNFSKRLTNFIFLDHITFRYRDVIFIGGDDSKFLEEKLDKAKDYVKIVISFNKPIISLLNKVNLWISGCTSNISNFSTCQVLSNCYDTANYKVNKYVTVYY